MRALRLLPIALLGLSGRALAANHLWIGYNPSARACENATTSFFNCVLGQTDFNELAVGFPYGEALVVGGTANVSCSDGDFQCVVNQGGFRPAAYDIVMELSGTYWKGGWNGTATVSVGGQSVFVNTAFVFAGNSCEGQTCLGAHEAFEAATDGISADCCNGQVHSKSCAGCDATCGRDSGNSGNPPWGCYPMTCGGATYYMELVSKDAASQYDISGCVALTATGGGGGSNPCAGVSAANGGLYCGSSTENGFSGGNPTSLYDCQNGQVASQQSCQYGCTVEPSGTNDQCNPPPKDPCSTATYGGYYCGESTENGFGGGNPDLLYLCNGGKTQSTTPCPYGCTIEPAGTNDQCAPPPPSDAGSDEGDAGVKNLDAGPADAGLADAGAAEDAGAADAGEPLDAGASDAGPEADAGGPPTDAGKGADGGEVHAMGAAGCGCGSAPAESWLFAFAAAALSLWRRRRPETGGGRRRGPLAER